MLNWLKAWWKARGERLCSQEKHAWQSTPAPIQEFGEGTNFLVNMTVSFYYDYAKCKRCLKIGRRVRS